MKSTKPIDFRWQRIVPLFLCLTAISYFSGQIGINQKEVVPINNCDVIEEKVDKSPNYDGGDEAVLNYCHANLLPIISKYINEGNDRISTFIISITISKSGEIVDCHIENELPKNVKWKLKNTIYKMPKWEPAIKNGVPVCFNMRLPMSVNWTN